MSQSPAPKQKDKQYWLNLTLVGMVGQVGCLTIVIILGAILGGLWLDTQFHTRPVITIVLLLVSIPISLGVMLLVVRAAISKVKAGAAPAHLPFQGEQQANEEVGIGKR